jgi:hypothetical protein
MCIKKSEYALLPQRCQNAGYHFAKIYGIIWVYSRLMVKVMSCVCGYKCKPFSEKQGICAKLPAG